MFAQLRAFAANESGATAIEYGLIAALISVAGITAFQQMGGSIGETFIKASTEVDNAVN